MSGDDMNRPGTLLTVGGLITGMLLLNGYLFKVMVALLDTPIIYLIVWQMRKHFGLKGHGAELKL